MTLHLTDRVLKWVGFNTQTFLKQACCFYEYCRLIWILKTILKQKHTA